MKILNSFGNYTLSYFWRIRPVLKWLTVISCLSTHFEPKPLMRTLFILLTYHNKWAVFFNIKDTNIEESRVLMLEDVDKVMETMWTEEEPFIDEEVQPIETFAEYESARHFKGFETLCNTVLDIDDQSLCSDVLNGSWTNVWWTTTTVWDISTKPLTNWHWMSNVKNNSCICCKWLCMTRLENKLWTPIFVQKFAHLTGMHTYTAKLL